MAAPRTIDPEHGRTRLLAAMVAMTMWERLHNEAQRTGRSLSAVTREVLERGLADMDQDDLEQRLDGAA
jgi:predicted DNA-binding protein